MPANKQRAEAPKILNCLESMVLRDQTATTTYGELAATLDRNPARDSRFVGQLTSRIDLACFYAQLPFLSLVKVLTATGEVNTTSFAGIWSDARRQLIANANGHAWTREDFARIRRSLNELGDEAVDAQWRSLERRHGTGAVTRALTFA